MGMVTFSKIGLRSGGFITAAYIAFMLPRWWDLLYVLVTAGLTWLIVVKLIMPRLLLFGRRKLSVMVLFGALIGWTIELVARYVTDGLWEPARGLTVMTVMLPALLANDAHRQGWEKTAWGTTLATFGVYGATNLIAAFLLFTGLMGPEVPGCDTECPAPAAQVQTRVAAVRSAGWLTDRPPSPTSTRSPRGCRVSPARPAPGRWSPIRSAGGASSSSATRGRTPSIPRPANASTTWSSSGSRSEEDKQSLLADPDLPFFTTPHFDGHPSVLLRCAHVDRLTRDELAEFVYDAWLARAGVRARRAWLAERGLPECRRRPWLSGAERRPEAEASGSPVDRRSETVFVP